MALTSASRFTGYGTPSSGVVDISLTRAAGEGIVVCVMSFYDWGAASDISSVVWDPAGDNQTLSLIASRTHSQSNRKTGLYYLAAPTSAKTSVLRVTLASTSDEAARRVFAVGHRVSGHDTAAMIRYNADREETDQGLNDFPVTVTSQTGDLVLGFLAVRDYLINVDAGDSSNYAEVDNGAGGTLTMATGSKAGASSVTLTFGFTGEANFDNSLYAVSVAPGSASATITLTPDPASVQAGSTRTFTITRSAAAGAGGVTYNLTSSATGVATVPATATILEGNTTITFDATGVSVGSADITATNAADSGETDTVALTVTAVTTKKCKFLVHPDFASATGITIEVNEAPTGGALTGAKLGFTTGVAAEATLEAGQAVIKVNAADVGASGLAAATSVRAIFKGLAASGSALGSGAEAGSVVVATGTIIEE